MGRALKKLACLGLLVVLMVVFLFFGFLAEVAKADDRPCVTLHEYQAVENGWTQRRVNNKFDTAGEVVGRLQDVKAVGYRACWTNVSDVHVYYVLKDRWRVYDKDRPAR